MRAACRTVALLADMSKVSWRWPTPQVHTGCPVSHWRSPQLHHVTDVWQLCLVNGIQMCTRMHFTAVQSILLRNEKKIKNKLLASWKIPREYFCFWWLPVSDVSVTPH